MRIFLLLNSYLPVCLSLTLRAALPTNRPEDHAGTTWHPGLTFVYGDNYSSYDSEDSQDKEIPNIVRPEENEED